MWWTNCLCTSVNEDLGTLAEYDPLTELVVRDLGLEGSKTKPLTTPGFKLDEKEIALRETEVPLESADAARYRSCVMRLPYLSQDRADLGEPVKCSARFMAKPTQGSLRDLNQVARYLLGTKHMVLHLFRKTFPNSASLDVVQPVGAQRDWFKWVANML